MPRGVYERKPWMGNFGRTHLVREEILALHAQGLSPAEISRKLRKSKLTPFLVHRVISGDWGNGWRKGGRPTPYNLIGGPQPQARTSGEEAILG